MSLIKEYSKAFIFVLFAFLIIGGGFYYNLVYTPQIETLASLKEENKIKTQELMFLEKQFKMIDQTKKELIDINMQTKALEQQIPTYDVSIVMLAEVIQYTDIYNYNQRTVAMGTELEQTEEQKEKGYKTIPVTIKYTTTYEDSAKFLEMLNRSYHMITIASYSIDNTIQKENESEDKIAVSTDTVQTELVLHMHYKEGGEGMADPNFMEYLGKEENIFERPLEIKEIEQNLNTDVSASDSPVKVDPKTVFNIHLADILRSGDNYSVSGYTPNQDPVYVGLTSSKDTKIALTIKEDSYTCLIEDSEGNKSEKRIDVKIENPSVNITSQIQNVMELMPTASIYIRNYTSDVINVNLRGTSLENVLIYNENNKLVEPGTQSGKIIVTR